MTPNDRTEEARLKLRAAALATPYFFGKLVCGFSDLRPDLHGAMSEWMLRKSPRKLGIVPRGFLKSSLWTIANNLRIATKYRHERILIVNETIGLPSTWIRMMQAIILSDIYRWLFPERVPDPEKVRWNATEIELAGRIPHPQPTIQAIGVGGASTGMHPTRVHEDDLVGKEASESQLVMQKAIDQHKLAESLIERPENPICTVGTRWGVYDLVRWMLENEPKLDFFKLAWRGRDGNPLWPERFPREVMDSIRRKYGAALFALQYENEAIAIGVTELRTEWLRFYHFGKDKDGETLLVLERRPEEGGDKSFRLKDCSRFMTIDPALSPESDAARSAFVTAALTPEVPYSIVLLGAVAKRVGPQHFVTEAYEQYKVWDATIAGIEVVAAQRSFYHWAIQQHPDFALRPLKTDSHKSKQTRIREFVPFYEQNRVYVQREQIDFLEEYESFPGGRTVDLLDATAYLPQIWFPPDGGAEVAEEEEEEEFEAYPTGRSEITGY